MLKKIAIIFVSIILLGLGLLFGIACTKPDTLVVERSISIKKSPEDILPLIDNFHNWQRWSPWEDVDPNLHRTFSGPDEGKGATYSWEGNNEAGSGRMEVEAASPSSVSIKLDFLKPFEGHYKTEFLLEPSSETTKVGWRMTGRNEFLSKVIQVFMDMDQMIGGQYEKGLARLKQLAEAA